MEQPQMDDGDNLPPKAKILLREKELVFQEKLQLLRTTKQTMSFLGVVTSVLLGSGYQYDIGQAFVILPFVINALCYYLLVNLNAINVVCGYIRRIDEHLCQELGFIPFYEAMVGPQIRGWGFNITRHKGYFTPNPYVLFGVFLALLGAAAYAASMYEGWVYLSEVWPPWAVSTFYVVTAASLLVLISVGVHYGRYGAKIADNFLKYDMRRLNF